METLYRCKVCGKSKHAKSFGLNGKSRNVRSTCRACTKTKKRRMRGALALEAVRERAIRRRELAAIQKAQPKPKSKRALLIERLISEDPSARSLNGDSQEYRARYRYDPIFRAKELTRRELRKTPARDDGSLTPRVVARLFAASTKCAYCRSHMASRDKSLDHIVPRSRGGWHSLLNVVVCCRACNAKKHAKIPKQLTLGAA